MVNFYNGLTRREFLYVMGALTLTACQVDENNNNSNSGSDAQAPTIPNNLVVVVVSSSQINLTWTPSTDLVSVVGYKIFRDGVHVGTSTTNSFDETGLSSYTAYSYTVSAFDAAEKIPHLLTR